MKAQQWRKLFAGIGVISMLLGVLMVVVPSSAGAAPAPDFVAGNPGCDDLQGTYSLEALNESGNGNGTASASDALGNQLTVHYQIDADGTVSFWIDSESDYLVGAVLIKQANYLGTNTAAVYYYDPAVTGDSGLTIYPEGDDELSHITFCGSTGSLSVDKVVTGDDAPDTTTPFSFSLVCTNNGNSIALGDNASFTLTDAQAAQVIPGIPEGSSCTLDETPVEGADTTISVDGGTATEGTTQTGIAVGDGTTRSVVVTNDFPSEEASLTVVKELTDEGGATFPFTLDDVAFDNSPLGHDGTKTFGDLAPGTYTVQEDTSGTDYELQGIVCVDSEDVVLDSEDGVVVDAADESVAVTLVDGDDVTCTFTNAPVADEKASLTVVKELTDEGGATFPFTLDDVAFDNSPLGHDGTKTFGDLAPGTYTVQEDTSGTDYELQGIVCVDSEDVVLDSEDGVVVDAADESVAVTLVDGDDVTCTFTNAPVEQPTQSLTVVKDLTDNGSTTFPFELNGEDFSEQLGEGDEESFDLEPGEHEVSEDSGTSYSLRGIECIDDDTEDVLESADGVTVDLATESVMVDLAEGQSVTCTFTNAPVTVGGGGETPLTYSIDIEKTNNADDDEDFTDSEFAEVDGEAVTFQIVISNTGTGTLAVTTLTDSFNGSTIDLLKVVDLECDRSLDNLPGNSETICTFTLSNYAVAGDVVVNTVTVDTARTEPASDTSRVITPEVAGIATGSITVVKDMEGDALADWQAVIDATGDGIESVTLTEDADSESWLGLAAGEYTLSEDEDALDDGVEFESLSCVDSDGASFGTISGSAVSLSLGEGDDVVCTFVNEYTAPTVAPAVVTPAAEVKGVQTVRTLPRTGDETRGLAGVGAFMLALGAAMVIGSRRQLARR